MNTSTFDGGGVWFATVDEALAAGNTPMTSKGSHSCNWAPPGPHGPHIVFHRVRGVAVWNPVRGLWSRYTCSCRITRHRTDELLETEIVDAARYCDRTHNPLPMNRPDDSSTRDRETTLRLFPVLRWFDFDYLPAALREASRPFCELAWSVACNRFSDQAETEVALRKLLEAKDAAVRAVIVPR